MSHQSSPATAAQKSDDLKVFISSRESICGECHENLGSKAWITLAGDKGRFASLALISITSFSSPPVTPP